MYKRRFLGLVRLIALVFLASGCVGIPKQEIQEYAAAFDQATLAGDALLDKVSPIIAEVETKRGIRAPDTSCSKDKQGLPLCFNLGAVRNSGRPTDPQSVLVRRVALNLISAYNGILVDLANGKSAAALQGRIGEVADLASGGLGLLSVNPALQTALPALAEQFSVLAGRFEQLRAQALVREAIAEGRHPVQALLAALANDAPDLYDFYRVRRRIDLVDAALAGSGQQAVVDDVNAFYESVASYVRLLDKTSVALDVLADAALSATRPTIETLKAAIQQATEIKAEADAFWQAIRKVRGP